MSLIPETVCPRPDSQHVCTYPECGCALSYMPADRLLDWTQKNPIEPRQAHRELWSSIDMEDLYRHFGPDN